MSARDTLEDLWKAGVQRVRGDTAVSQALANRDVSRLTHVLAIGKAADAMARAALSSCPNVEACLILTKHGHGSDWARQDSRVNLHESGHPVPDGASLAAGELALAFVSGVAAGAELLVLVSGGGSSLVESLAAGWDLERLQGFNREMLADGLDIHEMNRRRSEISLVKNGRLLARSRAAGGLVLAISDVPGEDLSVIASGIGLPPSGSRFDTEIIASNTMARLAIEDAAAEMDIEVIVNSESLYGDLHAVAAECGEIVRQGAPGLYVFGGEPTVVLPANPGEGGRNQALAVAMARELAGLSDVAVLAAGTDGSDGPTGSAGGFVTGEDWVRVPGGGEALAGADSGTWLRRSSGLFETGPTGTNVMDVMLVLKSAN